MKILKSLVILLLVCFGPSIAIYLHDKAQSEERDIPFQHAQLGYMLTEYAPAVEQMIRTTASEQVFEEYIVPVMKEPAFSVAIKVGAVLFLIIALLEGSRLWSERERGSVRASLYSRAFERTGGRIKYKRRK